MKQPYLGSLAQPVALAARWGRAGHYTLAGLLLVANIAHSQSLTVGALTPTRNAVAAPRTTPVSVTFDQPLVASPATLGSLRVFGQQASGPGVKNVSVSGNTLSLTPTTPFKPGETVFATVTTGTGSSNGALATPQVFQFTTATAVAPGSFAPPAVAANGTLAVGLNPNTLTVGDIDGDGDLDLLTAHPGPDYDGMVNIRVNNGAGVFTSAGSVVVDNNPGVLALGDVDGDGDLDLLTSSNTIATVSVRLNNGAGVFTVPANGTVPVDNAPVSVTLGDVDGDGDLDLVTGNRTSSTVSVRLNNGNGGVALPTVLANGSVSVDSRPYTVALGDVDNDGDLDLLSANYNTAGTVSVRFNNGTGVFAAPTVVANGTVSVDSNPRGIVLGDIDKDGDLDLLTVSQTASGTVSVRLNNGAGVFTAPTNGTIPVGSTPGVLVLGDVEGDGDLDVLTANYNSAEVSIRLNDGAGSFTVPTLASKGAVPVAGNATDISVADIDGDGDLDLLTTHQTAEGTVSVRLNQPLPPIPTLSSISAPIGNSVTLTGTNLTGATAVTFNGVPATTFSVMSATQIATAIPANVASGLVTVTTPSGTSSGIPFTTLLPTLTDATASAGGSVTITGTNLAGTTSIDLGKVPAVTFTVRSATQIIATFSSFAFGGPLRVTTPYGTSNTINYLMPLPLGIAGLQPARNAIAAPRTTPVRITVSQSVLADFPATRNGLRVFSQQAGGLKAGSVSITANTLTLTPSVPFKPGETVLATIMPGVQTYGGAIAPPQVFQFTVATAVSPGTFVAPAVAANGTVPVGSAPEGLAVGDVDGDGDLDLLAANSSESTVSVRLNNGAGVYTVPANGTVPVGSGPFSVVLGDVDGDGDLDLLTADYGFGGGSTTVSVRLNNGAGVFTIPAVAANGTVKVGNSPYALTLSDIDADGDLDLLTANGDMTITIRFNNGDGVFTTPITTANATISVAAGLQSVVLGDVDSDGDQDLLVAGSGGTLSVQLNNGVGIFTNYSTVLIDATPTSVVLGDVDGDGDLDLLASTATSNVVNVRLNNGLGSFTTPPNSTVAMSSRPRSLVLGDVDGDGDLDLLTVSSSSNTVGVRLNNGTGTFAPPAVAVNGTVPIDGTLANIALGDVDNDGDLDLLASRSGAVNVRLNQDIVTPILTNISTPTGGSFNTVTLTGANLTGATEVSFNGQVVNKYQFIGMSATELTLILPATITSGPVKVTTPNGVSNTIQFVAPPFITSVQPTRNAPAAPRSSLVSVSFGQTLRNSAATLSGLRVFSQQTGGRKIGTVSVSGSTLMLMPTTPFKPGETVYATVSKNVQEEGGTSLIVPQVFQFTAATAPASGIYTVANTASVGAGPSSPVLGDVDGDGNLDLLVATTSRTVSVRQNAGNGTYAGTQELPLDDVARQLVLGDVDGDSDLDLVAVLQNGSVRLLRNQGSGTFTSASFPTTDSGQGIAIGDVDADGDLDVVLTKPALGLVNVFTNDGSGNFGGGSTSGIVQGISPTPVLGDADGDGDLDLFVTDYLNRQARIYVNIGGAFYGNASTLVNSGGGGYVDALAVGDIDNDGDLDLLTASYTSSRISVRRNLYGAYSGTEEVDLQARGPLTLALGDVDGDGDLDLITTNQNTRTIGVRFNDGTGAFSGSEEIPLSQQAPGGLALGDVDGDGDLDLVTPHAATNSVSVLVNQNQLRTPENPANAVAGVDYQYYEGAFSQLPDFATLPVVKSGIVSGFDVPGVQPRDFDYAVRFTGYLQAPTSGQYSFFVFSDDGAQLFVGSTLVVSNDGVHDDAQEHAGTIGLQAGTHAVTLTYFQGQGGGRLTVFYQGPDGVRRLLPASSLVRVSALASTMSQASRLSESAVVTTSALQLYPNPSTGHFVVRYNAQQAQGATLVVSDRLGRVVQQQAVPLQAGENEVAVDLSGQAHGMYQVLLRPAHDQPQAQKLMLMP
jgi:hypothetical protein